MLAPAEVDSGLACGCTCVGCGANLIAKKGAKVSWHFAHHISTGSQSCVESAVHAEAKQLLLDANYLRVPMVAMSACRRLKSGHQHTKVVTMSPDRVIRFDYSRSEVWEGAVGVRPDVVGYRGDRRLLVEMHFTHAVDPAKQQKLEELGIPALEVSLFGLDSGTNFEMIRQRVIDDVFCKHWLFYPGESSTRAVLQEQLDAEAEELDRQHEAKVELERRRELARIERVEKARADVQAANERYRLTSTEEKERVIRESLAFSGAWPYFLNKHSEEAAAIAEPARVWQGAVFVRFIQGKAVHRVFVEVEPVAEWVASRFGVVDGRHRAASLAVRKFLGYLCACGFLEKDGSPYGRTSYQVVSDRLTPRPKHSVK